MLSVYSVRSDKIQFNLIRSQNAFLVIHDFRLAGLCCVPSRDTYSHSDYLQTTQKYNNLVLSNGRDNLNERPAPESGNNLS